MKKRNKDIAIAWSKVVSLTILLLISFGKLYQHERMNLLSQSKALFQTSFQNDTDRRIKELGNNFKFSYAGSLFFERDSITIVTTDTILYLENDKDAAQKMSPLEKADLSLQFYLLLENPIQISLLDSTFKSTLRTNKIPAQTAIRYTLGNKTEYSSSDTSFCQSFAPLDEIVLGAKRVMVLQAFVQIPSFFIAGNVIVSNVYWFLIIMAVWGLAIFWTFKKNRVKIVSFQEAPRNLIQITEDILFDDTHGVLYYQTNRVRLINQRLKLFRILLSNQGDFITADKLKETIWPEGCVSKDALVTTVKRLKEDLRPIVGIKIESARGYGYMLRCEKSSIN